MPKFLEINAASKKPKLVQPEDDYNQEPFLDKFNREECNKEFRKGIKKYYLFKVKKTPCVDDMNDLISFNTNLLNED